MSLENVEDAFALSPIQTGMLFDSLATPEADVYVTYVTVDMSGAVDVVRLQAAWLAVYERHQALRAEFHWDGLDEPLQVIVKNVVLPWTVLDWRDIDVEQHPAMLNKLIARERSERIDISTAPLSRMILVRLDDQHWRILWAVHHLLADGLSTPTILEDVLKYYAHLPSDEQCDNSSVFQYSRYISWLASQDQQIALDYWEAQLAGAEPTPMRFGPLVSSVQEPAGHENIPQHKFGLSKSRTEAVMAFCVAQRLTLSTFLHGAWALLVREYSGCSSSLFASTVSGRQSGIDGMETAVGLYLNAQPRWIDTSSALSLSDWLQAIQRDIHSSAKFEYSSLRDIQTFIATEPNQSAFESIITIGGHPSELDLSKDEYDISFTDIHYQSTQSHYDLAFLAFPGATLDMSLVYTPEKYNCADIERMAEYLDTIIEVMTTSTHFTPVELSQKITIRMSPAQSGLNPVEAGAGVLTVHHWFESVVDADPGRCAIRYNNISTTFGELDARANRIARFLQANISADGAALVGLMLPPGVELISGLLGILKAGFAYVPIDPDYPEATIQSLISAAEIEFMLSASVANSIFKSEAIECLNIEEAASFSDERIEGSPINPDNLAYVMFTSGSSGVPKGVKITHANLLYSTAARIEYYNGPPPRFMLLSSVAFDSSVAGIYWCLCSGGTLVLPLANQEKDIHSVSQLVANENVSHTLCLPGYYELLLRNADPSLLSSLEIVIVAGEACSPDLARLHFATSIGAVLFNEYGPTEACVWSSVYRLRDEKIEIVPIGSAIADTYLEVLNTHGNPCPPGIEGEIVIGGRGVSSGYLHDVALTELKFVEISIGTDKKAVVYKTGDLGYRSAGGDFVFTGRVDRQLKIRGHRIEPGSVEAILNGHDAIDRSLVVAVKHSDLIDQKEEGSMSREKMLSCLLGDYSESNVLSAIDESGVLSVQSSPPV